MSENLETVQAIYEAFGRGDVDAILERLTDDVDWATNAEGDEAPWYGRREGKEQVAGFFQGISEASEVLEFTPLSFAAGENDVHVLIRYRFRRLGGGPEVEMQLHHYWRLRDGKVDYYRGSEDTALVGRTLSG